VRRKTVYRCPSCGGVTHPLSVVPMKEKWDGYFTTRGDGDYPAFRVTTVLCWWCRERHSPDEVEACMALPRKKAGQGTSTSSTSSALDAGLLTQFSEILAFLTATAFEDGSKRQTGKLALSFASGMWGLSLQDQETQQYAFLEGFKLDDLLLDVEIRLKEERMPWRASKWSPKGRK